MQEVTLCTLKLPFDSIAENPTGRSRELVYADALAKNAVGVLYESHTALCQYTWVCVIWVRSPSAYSVYSTHFAGPMS